MNADAPKELLNVRPFEPVDSELSIGQLIPIRHPENVIVTRNTLVAVEPETDMVRWVSLIHIASVRRNQAPSPV
jgi:hypothetical protein